MDSAVYARFIRKTSSREGSYELLAARFIPAWSVPRQGEWVRLKLISGGMEVHSQVEKVTFNYQVEHVEVVVR